MKFASQNLRNARKLRRPKCEPLIRTLISYLSQNVKLQFRVLGFSEFKRRNNISNEKSIDLILFKAYFPLGDLIRATQSENKNAAT